MHRTNRPDSATRYIVFMGFPVSDILSCDTSEMNPAILIVNGVLVCREVKSCKYNDVCRPCEISICESTVMIVRGVFVILRMGGRAG